MADRKGYNGLRQGPVPFGGQIHDLSRRQPTQEEMQAMISQQLQVLAREIYCRAAADMTRWPEEPQPQHFRGLAHSCQTAARAYFEAMGVQFTPDEPAEPDSPEPTA